MRARGAQCVIHQNAAVFVNQLNLADQSFENRKSLVRCDVRVERVVHINQKTLGVIASQRVGNHKARRDKASHGEGDIVCQHVGGSVVVDVALRGKAAAVGINALHHHRAVCKRIGLAVVRDRQAKPFSLVILGENDRLTAFLTVQIQREFGYIVVHMLPPNS